MSEDTAHPTIEVEVMPEQVAEMLKADDPDTRIEGLVLGVYTNHLPHIYDKLGRLEGKLGTNTTWTIAIGTTILGLLAAPFVDNIVRMLFT